MMAPLSKKSRRELRTKDKLGKKKSRAPKKALREIEQAMS